MQPLFRIIKKLACHLIPLGVLKFILPPRFGYFLSAVSLTPFLSHFSLCWDTASLYEALSCFYLQKTLNLCLCICSKFTLSTEYLSTVLLSKVPAAGYSLKGMASLPILHGPEAFCLCLSHGALCFPWPAASVLRLQPDDWGHISSPLLLAGGEGNDQFGTDIKKSSSIA